MTSKKPLETTVPTNVNWYEISNVGMPPSHVRIKANGLDRTFLVRGEFSIYTAYVFADGSGFDADSDDAAVAWAVIDGF